MAKFIISLIIGLTLSGCYRTEVYNSYSADQLFAKTMSPPIYLSFPKTKGKPFYFLLTSNNKHDTYQLKIHWSGPGRGDLLFKGMHTTVKFLVNKQKIYSFKPDSMPKVIGYNFNNKHAKEEAVFTLTQAELRDIAYADQVEVELTGRYNTVVGEFNSYHTRKAFQKFYEQSF